MDILSIVFMIFSRCFLVDRSNVSLHFLSVTSMVVIVAVILVFRLILIDRVTTVVGQLLLVDVRKVVFIAFLRRNVSFDNFLRLFC